MNSRRLGLIVGLVLALGTGALLINYMRSVGAAESNQLRTVVVAARDIPARVSIDETMLQTSRRLASEVDPDALTDKKAADGMASLITIPAGSIVSGSKIGKADLLALPHRLARGLRAVSISIDRVKGVAGLIEPGDRVDVIAVPPRVANETPRATTILRGALVLAMGGETEVAHATPSPDQNLTTVTLAVTPKQADLLALADVNTTLRLALRAPEEPIRAYPAEALQLGVQPEQQQQPAAPAATTPRNVTIAVQVPDFRNRKLRASVPIIDGDRLVDATSAHP